MKKYYADFYPFWDSSSDLPDFSTEETLNILDIEFTEWNKDELGILEISVNDIELLNCKSKNPPHYVKIDMEDGQNILYYILNTPKTILNVDDTDRKLIDCSYRLDFVATYFLKFHSILKEENIPVKFLKKMGDRFLYEWQNNQATTDLTKLNIIFDFWRQTQFANITPDNFTLIRKYCWSTSSTTLKTINSITNNNFTDAEYLHTDNRYHYLICNSNAHTWTAGTAEAPIVNNQGDQNIYIIPLRNNNQEIIAFQRKDTVNFIAGDDYNPLGPAFMGAFASDVPPDLLSVAGSPATYKNNFTCNWLNANVKTQLTFRGYVMPCNGNIRIRIRNFSELDNTIFSKLYAMLNRIAAGYRDVESEPAMLNPAYYYETIYFDEGFEIKIDMSNLKFNITYENIGTSQNPEWKIKTDNLNLFLNISYSDTEILSFDFGDNTNESNTNFNNTNSNLRCQNPRKLSIFGSAAANYYANNNTTLYTGANAIKRENENKTANALIEQTRETSIYALNVSANTISGTQGTALSVLTGGLLGSGDAAKSFTAIAKDTVNLTANTAERWMNLNKEVTDRNQKLASQISNTLAAPSNALSAPFLSAMNKNIVQGTNLMLFRTYSYELNEWDKYFLYYNKLVDGYNYNSVVDSYFVETKGIVNNSGYLNYDRAQYFNTMLIDYKFNQAAFNFLLNNRRDEFGNWYFWKEEYLQRFLSFLGAGCTFWKFLLGNFDKTKISNMENSIPPITFHKTALSELFQNTNINNYIVLQDNENRWFRINDCWKLIFNSNIVDEITQEKLINSSTFSYDNINHIFTIVSNSYFSGTISFQFLNWTNCLAKLKNYLDNFRLINLWGNITSEQKQYFYENADGNGTNWKNYINEALKTIVSTIKADPLFAVFDTTSIYMDVSGNNWIRENSKKFSINLWFGNTQLNGAVNVGFQILKLMDITFSTLGRFDYENAGQTITGSIGATNPPGARGSAVVMNYNFTPTYSTTTEDFNVDDFPILPWPDYDDANSTMNFNGNLGIDLIRNDTDYYLHINYNNIQNHLNFHIRTTGTYKDVNRSYLNNSGTFNCNIVLNNRTFSFKSILTYIYIRRYY